MMTGVYKGDLEQRKGLKVKMDFEKIKAKEKRKKTELLKITWLGEKLKN
uniref:Uncharacterized protein n=1 Tax=Tetranychus urticae TaxID=32264 RepID=T1JWY9_TETUR